MRQDTIIDTAPSVPDSPSATPLAEFDAWVQARYAETVDAAGDDGIDKITAVTVIAKKAKQQIESGKLRLPLDVTARLVLGSVGTVDNRERRKTNTRISEVVDVLSGNTILNDDDPLLDAVALVGDGKRKTWRHVNADDITHMMVVKARHAQDAAASAAEFTRQAAVVLKALRKSGADAVVADVL